MSPGGPLAAAPAVLAVHADWSTDPRKRWMTLARPEGEAWRVTAPEPVGAPESLFARLRARAAGLPVAFGIDCPIGVPASYARHRPEPDFPAFLRGLKPEFFQVAATLEAVSIDAPFYPMRGQRGMTRLSHAQALGLPDATALSRLCDRATAERPAGAPVFWTLGANQSGKAAISAWRDMLVPALAASPSAAMNLWPFDGPFLSLLRRGGLTIAETYPAEAMRHLNLRPAGSKRRLADRAAYAPGIRLAMKRLNAIPAPALAASLDAGFSARADGEDQFDSVLGVLCVLAVLQGARPDTAPPEPAIQRWEGWVLGQTALPRAPICGTASHPA